MSKKSIKVMSSVFARIATPKQSEATKVTAATNRSKWTITKPQEVDASHMFRVLTCIDTETEEIVGVAAFGKEGFVLEARSGENFEDIDVIGYETQRGERMDTRKMKEFCKRNNLPELQFTHICYLLGGIRYAGM